jgi:hypothetical protein
MLRRRDVSVVVDEETRAQNGVAACNPNLNDGWPHPGNCRRQAHPVESNRTAAW